MSEVTINQALSEIEAAPDGPEVGAFFDLDGTLIDGFSAAVFARHRLRNREIGAGELADTVKVGVGTLVGRAGFEEFLAVGGKSMAGKPDVDMVEVGEQLFATAIAKRVYRGMRRLVEAHQAKGHTVVMASSATSYQVEPVAASLGIDHVVCNRMGVDDDGLLTGEFLQPIIWGGGKADAAQAAAIDLGLDLTKSWFYADGNEDVAFMHLVGHPRPVNPGSRLETVANRRGWPVLRVMSDRADRVTTARNFAGIAAMVPAAAVGLGIGVISRDKRRGVDTALPLWVDALLRTSGVSVKVVSGRQYLERPRPAVFIFNHKNNWDPFIAGSLVRTGFTGVAKKDLEKSLLGPIGKLVDAAFIDRADTASSVAALKPLEELGRKGLSILISPEGQRSPDGELGPFKKGAFRMAMATGLPVVPIVIRNAEVLGTRDSTAMRAGTVQTIVLPPVPVHGWKLEDLDQHINEVRHQFVKTLADWPE